MADMTVTVSDPAPEAAAPVIDNAPPPAAEVVDNSPAVAVEAQDETGGSREEQIRILREKLAALEAEGSAVMDEQIPAKDESPDEEDKEKSAAADSADRIRSKVYNEVIKQFRERDIALDEVRPIIGMGVRTSAMDSAESVYRYALTRKGVAAPEGINLAGLKGMVAAILATSGVVRTAAQDAAPAHVEDDGIAALLSGVRTV